MAFVPLEDVYKELLKRHPKGLYIGVAVDGSTMSDRAAHVAANLANAKRGDKLNILHISDRTKTYLPKHLQPQHLRNYYQDLAATARVKADWICREKEEGQSTCQALTRMADKNSIDLLVVGSFGRKGEKLDMLGTVSDFSLRESHASICIVRSTGHKSHQQSKYLFATDGSHAAGLAFCILVALLRRPLDIINVVMVTTSDGVKEQDTIAHYKEFMEKHKAVGLAFVKTIDVRTTTIPQGILEAAHETDADVLVMGVSGYGRKRLGSVSEEISVHANCTTLMIKDSREVLPNRYSTGIRSIAAELVTTRGPTPP